MAAAESDQPPQILQDEPNIHNVHKDTMFAYTKFRKSHNSNILKHANIEQSSTDGFTLSGEHGLEITQKYLDIEEFIDSMDFKNRRKCEVPVSEKIDETELIEMSRHIFKSLPIGGLQQSNDKLNKYEIKEIKLGYSLDPNSLKKEYSTIAYVTDIRNYIDIIHRYIFRDYTVSAMHTENPANIYTSAMVHTNNPRLFKHDYTDLRISVIENSENTRVIDITIEPKYTVPFKSMPNRYLNDKQGNNYQHEIENINKLKYINVDNSEFDTDDKFIPKMRNNEEEYYIFESNLLAEDTSKILFV